MNKRLSHIACAKDKRMRKPLRRVDANRRVSHRPSLVPQVSAPSGLPKEQCVTGGDVITNEQGGKSTWKKKYEELRDRMADLGLMEFEALSKPERYRLLVTEWIRENHGDVKVTPNSLHTLKPKIKRKAMDRLYLTLGQNPKAKETVHDVFRKPRRRKKRRQEYFSETP